MRLDAYLCAEKKFASRTKAAEAIEKGLVKLNGKIPKPSSEITGNDVLEITEDLVYVSNGGYKLERAKVCFGLDFNGKVFADIGASTGGYTDCLLKNGAKKVYAVDVGENQLADKLKTDGRVAVMDRTNARNLTADDFDCKLDGVTVDCSFISLKLLLPPLSQLIADGYIVALIKPQFECDVKKKFKNGVIRDKKVQINACLSVYDCAVSCGLTPVGFTYAPLKKDKNTEFLILLVKNAPKPVKKDEIVTVIEKL